MMVMVDSNFLIKLVNDNQTYRIFLQSLERSEISLGLPTPVVAEFLVKDNNYERATFLSKVNSFTQTFDFDMKSALLSAEIFRNLQDIGYIKENNSKRQVIKVDIQIISIAVANRVSKLYTADKGIIEIIDQLDLPIEVINFEKDELLGMTLFESSLD
ncbi:type II toxin-antitoxin system VapC family toxin [Psychrobacter immobilis]|uniref:type II toxin-antitoxin system VapC family toxin n=1 Tax=Psychrobacter TaxID=497 RepID=UPI00191A8CFB|nr:PIN domain-containing protein [Psychrobacter immobilis]